jgi:hypothetical protein
MTPAPAAYVDRPLAPVPPSSTRRGVESQEPVLSSFGARGFRSIRGRLGDLGRLLESIFHQQGEIVTLVEDLAPHIWIQLAQATDLAVLLGNELLVQRGDLDVEVELREVEIRREALGRVPVPVPRDLEAAGLVLPPDFVEIQQLGELALAVVGKLDLLVGKPAR